jgi:hypothetical protein
MFNVRWLWVTVVVLGCLLAEPNVSAAQDEYGGSGWGSIDICGTACVLVLVGVVILPAVTFTVAQVVYGVQGEWFPVGWAVPELIYGGIFMALSMLAAADSDEPGDVLLFGAFYGWFVVHAVLSLVLNGPGARAPDRGATRFAVLPTYDGASAVLSGSF